MKMTKRKTKQTPHVNLSKQGQQWLDEVDWDLLEELEMEEEGQTVPMRDNPTPRFRTMSQVSSRDLLRVDHFPQFKRQVPKK